MSDDNSNITQVASVWDLEIGVDLSNNDVFVRECGEIGCTDWKYVEADNAYTALIVRVATLSARSEGVTE